VNYLLTVLVHSRLKTIRKFTSDKSLLDVGCGKGRFVSTAQSYGWKACGYDYSKTQAAAAIEKYNIEVFSGNTIAESLNGRTFDVVTCWHVLEHVDNPRVLVRQMSGALKTDGILVIEVPNAGSWQARMGRSRWFQADVPRHIHHFSYKNITSLLESENLTIKKTCTWSLELGPFGMLQTILNLLGFSPNLLFRWLKRVEGDSIVASIFCIVISLLLSIPALLLELISVVFMNGGVQTVYATKNSND
jgi:SAM-dependent methyltransferase